MAAKAPAELQVISRTYDLVVWSCRHLEKFPRSFRFTMGEQLERRLYRVLELLIQAKFSRERLNLLRDVNLELELLRFQFRLAKDLKCLSIESYGFASREVNEIGKLVGGWMKSSTNRVGETS